jgi:hypothetical protein
MLNIKQFDRLLDDLKVITRLHKIVRDESDDTKRHFAALIVEDEMNRLYQDLCEIKDDKNV